MRSPPPRSKKIARERIAVLFCRAGEFFQDDPLKSDRCVALARKISMRHRVRIDRFLRKQFCRHCYRFLVPGRNVRVRIARGKVIMTCLSCGRQMRIPVKKRHEERQQ
ncbi:MAG: ribonuclease P [Methanoregulaceae archaeon]|nr:ribonuclease P [Methanoregulaceae archaeon]